MQVGAVAVIEQDQVLQQRTVYVGAPAISLGQVQGHRAISDLHGANVNVTKTGAVSDTARNTGIIQRASMVMQFIGIPLFSSAFVAPVIVGVRIAFANTKSLIVAAFVGVVLVCLSFVCGMITTLAAKWALIGNFNGHMDHWSLRVQALGLIGAFGGGIFHSILPWLRGTELLNMILRMLGARIGQRVFFDTHVPQELDALTVKDDVVLDHCQLVMHAIDNGRLQFAPIHIGNRCIIGHGSHLGAMSRLEDDAVVLPGTYVVKGSVLPRTSTWVGNPPSRLETKLTEKKNA